VLAAHAAFQCVRFGSSLSSGLPSSAVDSGPVSVDLSEVAKLQDVVFRLRSMVVTWVTATLQTISTKHWDLQHLSIHTPFRSTLIGVGSDIRQTFGEEIFGQWLELDHLLVQFLESRSIRPKVVCTTLKQGDQNKNTRYCVGCLLPEVTKRGIIDLV